MYTEYSSYTRPWALSAALLGVAPTLTFDIPSLNRSETYPRCIGSASYESCPRTNVGLPCGGICKGGAWVPVTGTCAGTCLCNVPGWEGRPICSGGSGSCSCSPSNAGSACYDETFCTGSGAVCSQTGVCLSPLTVTVERGDGIRLASAYTGVDGVQFGIYAVWTKQNVTSTSARGSDLIQVSGFGFNPSSSYKCRFILPSTCINHTRQSSLPPSPEDEGAHWETDAFQITYSSLLCEIPTWYGAAAPSNFHEISTEGFVELSLIGMFDMPVPYTGNECNISMNSTFSSCCPPAILVFEIWYAVIPSKGPTSGGTTTTISGYGFSFHRSYVCQFSSLNAELIMLVNASVVNSTSILCSSPVWNSASEVNVNLYDGIHKVHCESNVTFLYEARWVQVHPNTSTFVGGINLTLKGSGFATGVQYLCTFVSLSTQKILSNSTALMMHDSCVYNPSIFCELICILPKMQTFEGSERLVGGLFGLIVKVVLFQTTSESHNVILNSIAYSGLNGGDTISVFSSWNQYFPTAVGSLGGANLSISGFGFKKDEMYFCRFTNSTYTLDSEPAFPIETTLLFFTSPGWGLIYPADYVHLSLMMLTENLTVPFISSANLNPSNILNFRQVLVDAFPSKLAAASSTLITIIGAGFYISGNSYVCLLKTNLMTESIRAQVINHTHMRCPCNSKSLDWMEPRTVKSAELSILFQGEPQSFTSTTVFTVYFVTPASLMPIVSINGSTYFNIPQGVGGIVVLDGADPSPYTYVGLSLDAHSCQSLIFVTPISNSTAVLIYNNWSVLGRISLCYSTDGEEGQFFWQSVELFSISPAFSDSIKSINFKIVGAELPFVLEFFGVNSSDFSHVLLSIGPNCTHCSECSITQILGNGSSSAISSKLLLGSIGNYSVCFSTAMPIIWIAQSDIALEVKFAAELITAITPTVATSGIIFTSNISGLHANQFLIIALAPSGNCNKIDNRSNAQRLTPSLFTALDSQAFFRLSAGVYSICISTSGMEGPYSEQTVSQITILPAANSESLSVIEWPGNSTDLFFVVGQEVSLVLRGIEASEFSFIAFSPNGCKQLSTFHGVGSLFLTVSFSSSGEFNVCFSTDSGKSWYIQKQTIFVIPKATSDSIVAIHPSSVPEGLQFNFSFSDVDVPIYSRSSIFSFAPVGVNCNQISEHLLVSVGQIVTSAIPVNIKLSNELLVLPKSRLSIERFKLCFTTNGSSDFVEQSEIVFSVIPTAETVSSVLYIGAFLSSSLRAVYAIPTVLNLTNPMAVTSPSSSMFSFAGPSKKLPCNVSYSSEIQQGLVPYVSLTFLEQDFHVLCYSTSGNDGPYFPIFDLHIVNSAQPLSITRVLPNRISAFATEQILFYGADFSPWSFVALASTSCNDLESCYVFALTVGNESQAFPVAVMIRDPGIYSIWYSTNGSQYSSSWQKQEAQGVQLYVTAAATSSTLRSVQVCGQDEFCTPPGSGSSGCTSNQRMAADATYFLFFNGVDYSDSTRVALSNSTDPMLGGPDCSEVFLLGTLNTGIFNQSCPAKIKMPNLPAGIYHFCLSTSSGLTGSWWPKGDDITTISIQVLPKVTKQSIISFNPASAPTGLRFNITLQGAEYSDFTWIAFSLSGCRNITNYTNLKSPGPLTVTFSFAGMYSICYSIGIDRIFFEQIGVPKFLSISRNANSSSIKTVCATLLESTTCSGDDGLVYIVSNTVVVFSFNVLSLTPFSYISLQKDSNCHNRTAALFWNPGYGQAVNVNLPQGPYSVCFGDDETQPFLQLLVRVIILPQATSNSILAADCLELTDDSRACIQERTLRVGVLFRILLVGEHLSPLTSVKLCRSCLESGGCGVSGDAVSVASNISAPLSVSTQGIYDLCYQLGGSWQLQTSNKTKFIAIAAWDAALIDSNDNSVGCAGGSLVTFIGTGFLEGFGLYSLQLFDNQTGNKASDSGFLESQTVSTDRFVVVAVPTWDFPATPVHLVLLQINYGPVFRVSSEKIVTLLPQVTKIFPTVGDKLGGEILSVRGFGFSQQSNWITPPIELEQVSFFCEFRSVESNVTFSQSAIVESPVLITCLTPRWSQAQWIVEDGVLHYAEVFVKFTVLNLSGVLPCTQCFSVTNDYNSNYNFAYREVNKPPKFLGMNVNTWEMTMISSSGGAKYSRENWTGYIDKGGPDESFQTVSFQVIVYAPSFFDILPQISENGTMTFTTAFGRLGAARIQVIADDNGGGDHQSVGKDFTITILPPTHFQGEFVLLNPVTIYENSEPNLFDYFANPSCFGISQDFLYNVTGNYRFEIKVIDPSAFLHLPEVDEYGSLIVQTARNWHGDTFASVRCISNAGNVSSWAEFTIRAIPVNRAPSFHNVAASYQMLEISNSEEEYHSYKYATNISANDINQSVTFKIVFCSGNPNILNFGPEITSDGIITFNLSLYAYGNVSYNIYLEDDGGTVNGGQNVSVPSFLTLIVLHVNQQPSFQVPKEIIFFEKSVDQTIYMPKFATFGKWPKSFAGPDNEVNQTVTFSLHFVSGSAYTPFSIAPKISNEGALFAVIMAFHFGYSIYNITISDNGGTAWAALDIGFNYSIGGISSVLFQVQHVNMAPSIGLPPEIYFWSNPYEYSYPPRMTVVDKCGMNCFDDNCGGGGSNITISQGCIPISPDGNFVSVPAKANFSAGPHEEYQNLTFSVVSAQPSLLFAHYRILANGVFLWKLRPGQTGTENFTVILSDNGGTANNGSDTKMQTLTVTVFIGYVEWKAAGNCSRLSLFRLILGQGVDILYSRVILIHTEGLPSRLLILSRNPKEMLEAASAVSELQNSELGSCRIGNPQFISINGNGDVLPAFSLPNPPILMLNASTSNKVNLINSIQVDSSALIFSAGQSDELIENINFEVVVLRCRAPASDPEWISGVGANTLFASAPTIVSLCLPRCNSGGLTLNLTGKHGIVEIDILLSSEISFLNASRRLLLIVNPSYQPLVIQEPFSLNLTLLEDDGCNIDDCSVVPKIFNTTEIFGNVNDWFDGADDIQVYCNDSSRLIVQILDDSIIFTPQLHQHGVFSVVAVNSASMLSPPLIVIVKHVNHHPYVLKHNISNVIKNENDPPFLLNLEDYIGDVDTVNQHDPYATVEVLRWFAVSRHSSVLGVSISGSLCLVHLLPNQYSVSGVNITMTATDSFGASASTNITIIIRPSPDAPFLQNLFADRTWIEWIENPSVFCENQVGQDSIATLDQCKSACLNRSECVAITFYSVEPHCFISMNECSMMQSSSSADEVATFTRPRGIVVNESDSDLVVGIRYLFGDYDNCETIISKANCTYDGYPLKIRVTSSDSKIVVAEANESTLILSFVRHSHTFYTGENQPIVITITATNAYNLSCSVSVNVTVMPIPNAPIAHSLPAIEMWQNSFTSINISTSFQGKFYGNLSVCDQTKPLETPGLWNFFDCDQLTFASGDALTLVAESADQKLFTVITSNHTAQSAVVMLDIVVEKGQFGLGQIELHVNDQFGSSIVAYILVKVAMINEPPFFLTQNIVFKRSSSAGVVIIPNFVSNISRGLHLGDIESKASMAKGCYSGEDCCNRPPVRAIGDCWGFGCWGQNISFSIQLLSDVDTALFLFPPSITADRDLIFQVSNAPSELTDFCDAFCFSQVQIVHLQVAAADDGGTNHGGRNLTEKNFTISIIPDYPPYFQVKPDIVILENNCNLTGYYGSRSCVITNFVSPPGLTSWQIYSFDLQPIVGDPTLLWSAPSIDVNGTLHFVLNIDRAGNLTWKVSLRNVYNMTRMNIFNLIILEVNTAPHFCSKNSSIQIMQGRQYYIPRFFNISSGGSACSQIDSSMGRCTKSVCGYNKANNEADQVLTFLVETESSDCSLFNCYDNLSINQKIERGWVSISPNGDLNISACNSGRENITVVLRDSGGTAFGGQDSTIMTLMVSVLPVTHEPSFELINNGVLYILEDSKDYVPFVAVDVSPGRCQEKVQSVTFSVYTSSTGIFSQLKVHLNGTMADLIYLLVQNANGVAIVEFVLTNGESSKMKNLTVVVLPVNDAPSFQLTIENVVMDMDSLFMSDKMAVGISAGPPDEETQLLQFGFQLIEGPDGLIFDVLLSCSGWISEITQWMQCHGNGSSTADAKIVPGMHRFGTGVFQIYLMDNGNESIPIDMLTVGTLSAPLPSNESHHNLTIKVLYSNIPPDFELATDLVTVFENSACNSETMYQNLSQSQCNRTVTLLHRHAAFAVAISKGSIYEDPFLCPEKRWLVAPSDIMFSCVSQTVTFTVIGRQGILFDIPPRIFEDGSLMFKLAKSEITPSGSFKVILTDSQGARSVEKTFQFEVIAVNSAPSFYIPYFIVGFENVPFANIVASDILAGLNEPNQQVTFTIQTDNKNLFEKDKGPVMFSDGTMAFTPRQNAFGSTSANITLTDDGGTEYGGISSVSKTVAINIVQVQSAPLVIASDVYVFENEAKFKQSTALVVKQTSNHSSYIQVGDCGTEDSSSCLGQSISFMLMDASNPLLFSRLPSFDENLSLTFASCSECSGYSKVSFEVIGSGYEGISLPDCSPCDEYLSPNSTCCFDSNVLINSWVPGQPIHLGSQTSGISFSVFVEPIDTAPEFSIPWSINLDQRRSSVTCPALDNVNVSWYNGSLIYQTQIVHPCENWSKLGSILEKHPTVQLLENSGFVEIEHFVSSISSSVGYANTSIAIFAYNPKNNQLDFRARREDPIFGLHGMEFNDEVTFSPDKASALFVGMETNTLAYWEMVSGSSDLVFQDCRSNGELRLRFGGWISGNSSSVSDKLAPRTISSTLVCGLEKVSLNGTNYIFVASGCDLLNQSNAYATNDSYKLDAIWASVVGHWDFTSAAMYSTSTPMKVSFVGNSNALETVTCGDSFCSYRRTRNNGPFCAPSDSYSSDIGPATFRDEAEKIGAAVMIGIPCTLGFFNSGCCKSGTEWDFPKESSLSATNFVVSADGYEAIQFDDSDTVSATTRGLYIAYSLDGLVDGNPSTSSLPLQQLSIEVWFTVGDISTSNLLFPLFSTLQQSSDCQKGWALSWFIAAGQFSLYFDISLDMALACRSKAECTTATCSLVQARCAEYGDGVGYSSVFTIPTAKRPSVQQGQWFHAVATYDGVNVNLFLNNVEMLSTPACEGLAYCGDLTYDASYHTCPQFCSCPPSCRGGNCRCGGMNQTIVGVDACPGTAPITIGAIDSSAALQGNAGKHRG